MNKKTFAKEPLRIFVEYNEHREGGEDLSDEEWSQRADTIVTVDFKNLYREPPKDRFYYDSVVIPDNHSAMLKMKKLFLAVVRYSTGDTFGHTIGMWHIVGLAPTFEIAQAMVKEAIEPSPEPKKGQYRHYKPWEGYFESLEDTEIHELNLI